ncbi:MAG TPA: MarR family transcriptional regulator [Oscillospiraceae bacterium]|nr:MarR family transcriptional regulator [Oscillospiraceae bacterium]HNW05150.1 MarR family transcriptional regulator [Oscillospiraceae bacterium]HPV99885.1 MarR family transcriptional regulator [Oscillospiraceae bacterium]
MNREIGFDSEEGIRQVIGLLRRAQRLDFGKIYRQIQSAEFILLGTIWDFCENEGPATVSQIKERLHVTPSAVTNLLRVLENKGLVYRRTDAGNRRKTFVFLTEEGTRVFREERERVDAFSVRIFREMGDLDSARAVSLLGKLVRIMENDLRKLADKPQEK